MLYFVIFGNLFILEKENIIEFILTLNISKKSLNTFLLKANPIDFYYLINYRNEIVVVIMNEYKSQVWSFDNGNRI